MDIWRFVVFAVASALGCAALRKYSGEQAALLALAGCAGLGLAALTAVEPVLTFLRKLEGLAGLQAALITPVWKTAAVGLLTQLTEGLCRDAGEEALARAVTIGGGMLALYALLPLAQSVAELLQKMLT